MSEIKVGDRVKVEFEGLVSEESAGAYRVAQEGMDISWFHESELTVIPKPIVLPTGKNALIELEGVVLLFEGECWDSALESWNPEGLQQFLDNNPKANYRVIFDGESE